MKRNRHPIPALRRYRRATIIEVLIIICLIVVIAAIVNRKFNNDGVFQIDESKLITEPVHIITMPPEETTEPNKEVTAWVKYPVPLDDDLQRWIGALCKGTNIPAPVVMAVIAVETGGTFDPEMEGDGGDSIGLMQINKQWHEEDMERLGVFDLTDPYQNVAVGIDILDRLSVESDSPIEWVLMAYNGGEDYANGQWAAGEITRYAQRVIALSECYLESAVVMEG